MDRLGIQLDTHRGKILTAVQLLREYDTDSSSGVTGVPPGSTPPPTYYAIQPQPDVTEDEIRPPAQTLYQYQYYQQSTTPGNKSLAGSEDRNDDDDEVWSKKLR